jgi:NADPH:quinone reductase-like Zn-dependent oxidoreductase
MTATMRASVMTAFGGPEVLQLREVPRPEPRPGEIRVRVRATTVNFGDLVARRFSQLTAAEFHMPGLLWLFARAYFGWRTPRHTIPGSEFAGEVDAVGRGVDTFAVGDAVFGTRGERLGAYAEYVCVSARGIVAHKPASLTFEEAAVVPYGVTTALALLRPVAIQPGQRVLVLGASGSIGAAVVQLALHHGAEVTGVCGAGRAAYVAQLGAHKVLDYATDDFTRGTDVYDLVVDVLGRGSFARSRAVLARTGTYLCASFKSPQLLEMARTAFSASPRLRCGFAVAAASDLVLARDLVEAGHLKPVVGERFALTVALKAVSTADLL